MSGLRARAFPLQPETYVKLHELLMPLSQLHPSELFICTIHASFLAGPANPFTPSLLLVPGDYSPLKNSLPSLTTHSTYSYPFFKARTTLLLQEAFPDYSYGLLTSLKALTSL